MEQKVNRKRTLADWIELLAEWAVRHRLGVLSSAVLVSIAASACLGRLGLDVSVESFLDPDDPDLQMVEEVNTRYGSIVPTVLAYEDRQLFTAQGLRRLDELTQRVAQIDYVQRAESLTTVTTVLGDDLGVAVAPLISDLPRTDSDAMAVKARVSSQERIVGNLVSEAGTVAAVVVYMEYVHGRDDEYALSVVAGMEEAADAILGPDVSYHLAGLPVFYQRMTQYVKRDLAFLIALPAMLIVLCLGLLTRRLSGVLIPLAVVGVTLLWTMGLMGALGEKLGIGSVLLPPLILVIGCADAVHVLNHIYPRLAGPGARVDAGLIAGAMKRVGVAVVVTSVTTSAGFFSLAVADVRTVRQFGIYAAVAIVIALVLSLVMVPALALSLRPLSKEHGMGSSRTLIDRGLNRVGLFNERRPGWVAAAWGLVLLVSVVGLGRLRIETGFRDQFRSGSPVLSSLDFIERNLSGPEVLTVFVDTHTPGGVLEPNILSFVRELDSELMRHQGVRRVHSLAHVLSDARQILDPTTPPGLYVPKSRPEAAQLLLLLETSSETFDQLVTDDRSAVRLYARLDAMSTGQSQRIVKALRDLIDRERPEQVSTHILGTAYMAQRLVHEIIDSQIQSFGLALVLILGTMVITLRSWTLAFVSMVPNIMPIVVMMGLMGWTGIPLNDVTIMTASIAIGIAVDDTIHYLVRFRAEHRATPRDLAGAMERTVSTVGRAMVVTSVVLAAGFGTATLASFNPPVFFGLLSVVTIITALAADLSLLPVMLVWFRSKGEED